MPLDYTSGSEENLKLDFPLDDDDNYILPADKKIITELGYAGIDSLGEKYRDIVEFDLNSSVSYDSIVSTYPTAWDTYFGGSSGAPSYSSENALKLKEAIAFYLWISEDESYEDVAAIPSIDFSPYIREEGSSTGTYENPNAFYDVDVYNRVTDNGANSLPRVDLGGDRVISASLDSGRSVDFSTLYSSEQLGSTEYETVRKGPKSVYDWGGPYATGKKTY